MPTQNLDVTTLRVLGETNISNAKVTGSLLGTASYADRINITGSGVTVNWNGSELQLSASAGGKVTISSTPPSPSASGDLWFDSNSANLYILYSYVSESVSASSWIPATSLA